MSQRTNGPGTALNWLAAAVVAMLLAGCLAPERRPARYPVFSQIKSVAVLPLQSDGGDTFRRALESRLVSLQGNPGVTFRVFTRSPVVTNNDILSLERPIRDQPASAADDAARRLGKLVGVQAVITGHVDTRRDVSHSSKQEQTCIDYSKKKKKCKQMKYDTSYCTQVTMTFRAILRGLDANSGRLLYSNSLDKKRSNSACSFSYPDVSDAGLLEAAQDDALDDIARDVAPYWVTPTLFGDSPHPIR